MSTRTVGVVMNGVTGRMGYRQHLVRSVLAMREQGGVQLGDGDVVVPEPILVGRSAAKLERLAAQHGLTEWTTDLDEALDRDDAEIYFDAQATSARQDATLTALRAGKHVYLEKPTAANVTDAIVLARAADEAGVRSGVVMDKLFLPGLLKLRRLVDGGFFGRVLSVRGEFGYWVFEGDWQGAQRPSWNYRAEDGGGIALDMLPHWSYVLEFLFGTVRSVYAHAATHIGERVDETGTTYAATADDASYAIFTLDGAVVAQINSSWTVRVFRDELVEFCVDGTLGSAVVGLQRCRVQPRAATPKPVWNPDLPATEPFRSQWQEVPDNSDFDNGFKAQWEQFLRHVYADAPFPYTLRAGARGVALAGLAAESARTGRRVEVGDLAG